MFLSFNKQFGQKYQKALYFNFRIFASWFLQENLTEINISSEENFLQIYLFMKANQLIFLLSILSVMLLIMACNKEETKDDPYPPFIVLKGTNPAWSPLGEPYEDAGAEAYDITASRDTINISARMQVNSNVNEDEIGSYRVTFNVTDEAGNQAEEI